MRGRTGLAAEQTGWLGERPPWGVEVDEKKWGALKVHRVKIWGCSAD